MCKECLLSIFHSVNGVFSSSSLICDGSALQSLQCNLQLVSKTLEESTNNTNLTCINSNFRSKSIVAITKLCIRTIKNDKTIYLSISLLNCSKTVYFNHKIENLIFFFRRKMRNSFEFIFNFEFVVECFEFESVLPSVFSLWNYDRIKLHTCGSFSSLHKRTWFFLFCNLSFHGEINKNWNYWTINVEIEQKLKKKLFDHTKRNVFKFIIMKKKRK